MKKLLFFIFACALIVGGFYLGMQFGARNAKSSTPSNTVENTTTTEPEVKETNTVSEASTITDDVFYEKAVEFVKDQKIQEEDHINTKPEYNKFVEYEGFGVAEEDGITYAYMWIVDSSYYKEKGKLTEGSGSSTAYKVKFENGEVVSYENPTDGAGYEESVKEMFPEKVAKEILAFNFDFSIIDQLVEEYYNN